MQHELWSVDPWKVIPIKGVSQQEPNSGNCSVLMLMFIIYLMFKIRLDFSSSHWQYFRKKNIVDIFNDNIRL